MLKCYPHDMNVRCCALLQKIQFKFLSVELEYGCHDYLYLYDGPSTEAPVLKTICETSSPANINTTSNQAFIKFTSDSSHRGRGFRIIYTALDIKEGVWFTDKLQFHFSSRFT